MNSVNVPYPDLTEEFFVTHLFPSRAELIEYVKGIAAKRNISLIISDSRIGHGNKIGYVKLTCDFGGDYRANKINNSRVSSSKKMGCRFFLSAKERADGFWSFVVDNGMHNHDFPTYPEGHSLGKLSSSEYVEVCEASKSSMHPNAILSQLKSKDENNCSTQLHIRNALIKFKKQEREGRMPLQQFFKLLHDNNYHVFMRKASLTDAIGDIFFSHPVAYNLLNSFPYVLQGDCTYNPNIYGLALLQILGFTCTGKNFTVAYALLQNEREYNYVWVLGHLRSLFQKDKFPSVMYTDRDLAFINAVERVFPKTAHYMCRRHIEVNVRARALRDTSSEDFSVRYMRQFNWAISAFTLDEWNRH